MKAFITGGTGFVGTNLTWFLVEKGHEVTVLARHAKKGPALPDKVNVVAADATKPGEWQNAVAGHDVLINLAGVSIFKRWNEHYKKLLWNSRILTTRNLVDAIADSAGPRTVLLSTSAVGYYGFSGDEEHAESAPSGTDFLAKLSIDWEAEALKARDKGVRVVVTRFGVVFGKDEGALPQMVRPFRFFAGGPVGSGRQWVSWIHIEDLCRAALHVIETKGIEGPVNFTAPGPVRNLDLAKAIGKTLGRPSFMPAPAFMIKLILGEFGSVVLEGQRVIPKVLEESGFVFNYPHVSSALHNLLTQ